MWYNYCNEPAGETEEEARKFAKNEMSDLDLIESLVTYGGYVKYLHWCLLQPDFWDKFKDDIIASDDVYFSENFTERDNDKMKIYYSLDTSRILTEEEATKYVKEQISDDDYALWEFITDNYCYNKIMENLSPDFLDNITKELTKNRLENPDYFLVREFPD